MNLFKLKVLLKFNLLVKYFVFSIIFIFIISCKKSPSVDFMNRDVLVLERTQSLCVPGIAVVDCKPKKLVNLGFTANDIIKAQKKSLSFDSAEWIKDTTNTENEKWVYHVSIKNEARGEKVDLRIFFKKIEVKNKEYNFVDEILANRNDITDSFTIYRTLEPFSVKPKTTVSLL